MNNLLLKISLGLTQKSLGLTLQYHAEILQCQAERNYTVGILNCVDGG